MPVLALMSGLLLGWGTVRPAEAQSGAEAWKAPAWLMTHEQVNAYFKSQYYKDRAVMKSAHPAGEQVKQIERAVDGNLSQIVQQDHANLPRFVDRFLNDIQQKSVSDGSRQMAMDFILAKVPDLMQNPDILVRYNVVSLVVQFSVKPVQYQGTVEIPAVPYNPCFKFLLSVLKDEKQYQGCRILAARGLMRLCRDGENAPSSTERSDIATAIIETLQATPPSRDDGVWWFRFRMIETLGHIDRIDNSAKQPIVLEALMNVLVDRSEVWLNRAQAAQSLSQLPFNSSTNVPLITTEVMKLLGELIAEHNKAPSATGLREPMLRVYLSFRPANSRQANEKKWGLLYEVERAGLNAQAPFVQSAWKVAFPLLKPFVESTAPTVPVPAIPAEQVEALAGWIQQNQPTNRRIVPGGKEYPSEMKNAQTAAGVGSE